MGVARGSRAPASAGFPGAPRARVGVFGGCVLWAVRALGAFTGGGPGLASSGSCTWHTVRQLLQEEGAAAWGCHLCHRRVSSIPGLCLSHAGDSQGHLQAGAGVSWRTGSPIENKLTWKGVFSEQSRLQNGAQYHPFREGASAVQTWGREDRGPELTAPWCCSEQGSRGPLVLHPRGAGQKPLRTTCSVGREIGSGQLSP